MCGNIFSCRQNIFVDKFFFNKKITRAVSYFRPTPFQPPKPSRPPAAVGRRWSPLPLLSISTPSLCPRPSNCPPVLRFFPSGYTSAGCTAPAVVPRAATRTPESPPGTLCLSDLRISIGANPSPHRATVLPSSGSSPPATRWPVALHPPLSPQQPPARPSPHSLSVGSAHIHQS